jgi:hypothetical protein
MHRDEASQHLGIGGVDDGVDSQPRDVALPDRQTVMNNRNIRKLNHPLLLGPLGQILILDFQDICREFSVNPEWLRTGEGEPYLKRTREAEIMSFAVDTIKGSNEFRRALVSMLATLDDDQWDGLESLLDKLLEQYKKD